MSTHPTADRAKSAQARAWHSHIVGRDDHAIEAFNELLNKDPEDIDTLYGLALAQKNAGQHEAAAKNFRRLHELLEPLSAEAAQAREQLSARIEAQTNDVLELAADISEAEVDAVEVRVNRVSMLMRMVDQQLATLQE